MTKKIQETRY